MAGGAIDSRCGVFKGVWTGGGGADLASPLKYCSVVVSFVVTVTMVVVADFDRCITAAVAAAPPFTAAVSPPLVFPGSGGSGGLCFGVVVACVLPSLISLLPSSAIDVSGLPMPRSIAPLLEAV